MLRGIAFAAGVPTIWLCVEYGALLLVPYFILGLLLNELGRRIRCDVCGERVIGKHAVYLGFMPRTSPSCKAAL